MIWLSACSSIGMSSGESSNMRSTALKHLLILMEVRWYVAYPLSTRHIGA